MLTQDAPGTDPAIDTDREVRTDQPQHQQQEQLETATTANTLALRESARMEHAPQNDIFASPAEPDSRTDVDAGSEATPVPEQKTKEADAPLEQVPAPEQTTDSLFQTVASLFSAVRTADEQGPEKEPSLLERAKNAVLQFTDTCTDVVCDVFHISDATRERIKDFCRSTVTSVFSTLQEITRSSSSSSERLRKNARQDVAFSSRRELAESSSTSAENPHEETHSQFRRVMDDYLPSFSVIRLRKFWDELNAAAENMETHTEQQDTEAKEEERHAETSEQEFRSGQVAIARASLPDNLDGSAVFADYVKPAADFDYRESVESLKQKVDDREG